MKDLSVNMEVTNYTHLGYRYRAYINASYSPLRELRDLYKIEGKSTWINPHNGVKWQLTVQMGKED